RRERAPRPSATIMRRASSTMTWRVRAGRMGSASQPRGDDAETVGIRTWVRRPAPGWPRAAGERRRRARGNLQAMSVTGADGVQVRRRRRVIVVLVAAALAAGACSSGGGDAPVTEGTAPALTLEAGAVVVDGVAVVPASTEAGRTAPTAWRDAPFEVEVKGGGAYLGHELLSSPDESEVAWDDAGVELTTESLAGGALRVSAQAPEGATQLSVSFACRPDERFFGLGAQS